MKLDMLRLENFRCYADLEIPLHPKLTVLVAENGQGKSTLLDAVRIALWPYVSSFDLSSTGYNDPANSIAISDVRLQRMSDGSMSRCLPSSVRMTGDYGVGLCSWLRYRESEAEKTKTKSDGETRRMEQRVSALQQSIRDPQVGSQTLSVFGYYGTGRLWSEKKLTKTQKSKDETQDTDFYIRTFGYRDCLDPASTYKHFRAWFIWASESYQEQRLKRLDGRDNQEELQQAELRLQVVRKAIDTFLQPATGWHSLEYSISREKTLVLRHDQHGTLNADQLSDGIRSVLAMIGDIAYRCIKLNPHLGAEAARQTCGVVLIDEVDMHLHPRWQQIILSQLQEAFPHIQFIVTTHSPQVLSSVDASCIRLLRQTTDPETGRLVSLAEPVSIQTRGVSSADLLARIMGVAPVPAVPEAQMLSDYEALIQQNLHEISEGQELRTRLEQHFGVNHPLMHECERLIRLQSFKQRLPRKLDSAED